MVEQSLVEQAKEAFSKKVTINPIRLKELVWSATDLEGNVPENFKCNICLQLVFEPEECNGCN